MKPLIIFDTDMDTDCDDVGALAMLLEAHNRGLIELLGIISDSVCEYAAPCCEAISSFYGVTVPIGTVYANDYNGDEENLARFRDYREHTLKCTNDGRAYNEVFSREISKKDKDYESATSVYRKLLENAEDGSVTVLCVGMLTAVSEFLETKSGIELFGKKVNKVITMGNPDKTNDFNWGMDAVAAEKFFLLCPVPVYISAEGGNVITGDMLTKSLPENHLLRRAYEIWLKKENCGRSSWDLIAGLFAIKSDTKHLMSRDKGNGTFVAVEKKFYTEASDMPKCKTVHLNCSVEKMTDILNNCMLGNFDNI